MEDKINIQPLKQRLAKLEAIQKVLQAKKKMSKFQQLVNKRKEYWLKVIKEKLKDEKRSLKKEPQDQDIGLTKIKK